MVSSKFLLFLLLPLSASLAGASHPVLPILFYTLFLFSGIVTGILLNEAWRMSMELQGGGEEQAIRYLLSTALYNAGNPHLPRTLNHPKILRNHPPPYALNHPLQQTPTTLYHSLMRTLPQPTHPLNSDAPPENLQNLTALLCNQPYMYNRGRVSASRRVNTNDLSI